MKRFQISFSANGKDTSLFVESRDETHTRFFIEREDNDPHPLLIELDCDNIWRIKSQDTWSLTDVNIHDLGYKINNKCNASSHPSTGINGM